MQMTVHHRGETWERDDQTIEQIDADLRDLSDSTVEHIAARLDTASMGSLSFESWHPDQRRATRARNELARRQYERERQAQRDAEAAKVQARQDADAAAAKASFRARAWAAFSGQGGTQAEFEQAFEGLWVAHLQQQTLGSLNNDAVHEYHRARMAREF